MIILTPSLPERTALLHEAMRSVADQTVQPEAHIIHIDYDRKPPAFAYNALVRAADSEWVSFLDDDDLLQPIHVETLEKSIDADPNVDVVYTRPHCVGHVIDWYFEPFSPATLRRRSIVPITAAVRREKYLEVGGMPNEWGADWRLWQRILGAGGRFRALEQTTWQYRRHAMGQRSYGEL